MNESMDSGLEEYRKGGIRDWRNSGLTGYRKEGGIQERRVEDRRYSIWNRRDAGQEGYRKGDTTRNKCLVWHGCKDK